MSLSSRTGWIIQAVLILILLPTLPAMSKTTMTTRVTVTMEPVIMTMRTMREVVPAEVRAYNSLLMNHVHNLPSRIYGLIERSIYPIIVYNNL